MKTGDFYIGVIGDSPVYYELKKIMKGKMSGDQKIVVKKFSSSVSSFDCHILFISEDESDNIKKIVARTGDTPVLLISESEGLASKGACINFIIVSDHLKLEINKNNIEQRKMNIASELLQLGKVVK
jgi:glutamine amidotransferase PdxT